MYTFQLIIFPPYQERIIYQVGVDDVNEIIQFNPPEKTYFQVKYNDGNIDEISGFPYVIMMKKLDVKVIN